MDQAKYVELLRQKKMNLETGIRELSMACDRLCEPRELTAEELMVFVTSHARVGWDEFIDQEARAARGGTPASAEIQQHLVGIVGAARKVLRSVT